MGVIGPMASGKSLLARKLAQNGFAIYSLSSILKDHLTYLKVKCSREALQDLGDFLRKHVGNDVLAEKMIKKIYRVHNTKIVIDGIRHPEEIVLLRKTFNIKLISIEIDERKRYVLFKKRKKRGDPLRWKNYKELSAKELDPQTPYGGNVSKCLPLVDYIIKNNGTQNEFKKSIDTIIHLAKLY